MEIAARRLNTALAGATVESAVAPGMVTMKTFAPPLDALAGRTIERVRRIGKMPVVEFGPPAAGDGEPLALLVHLMSAGRLQVFGERASLRDKRSRLLVRTDDGRELRLREFGTQQRAWAKLLTPADLETDEAVTKLGPEALPPPPLEEFAALVGQPRHLHSLLRDQRVIAGIGRSWVDEILWQASLSPFRQGDDLPEEDVERLHTAIGDMLGGALEHYEEVVERVAARQGADAAPGAPPRRRAVPALRHDDRGGALQGLRHVLLPGRADRRPRVEGSPALAAAEVSA